jgi:glycosyltransferase involved in cell wall biosynthesis
VTVLSSRIEGGANVLSEAIVAGVPVLSSDIDGSVGILGQDYAGYFPVGDTAALRACLIRAEQDPAFVRRLEEQVTHLAPRFTIAAETSRWKELLDEAPRWRPGS